MSREEKLKMVNEGWFKAENPVYTTFISPGAMLKIEKYPLENGLFRWSLELSNKCKLTGVTLERLIPEGEDPSGELTLKCVQEALTRIQASLVGYLTEDAEPKYSEQEVKALLEQQRSIILDQATRAVKDLKVRG